MTTTTNPTTHPIERLVQPFADRAMRAFAASLRTATPGSPLHRAFSNLTTDRTVEIALPVLRSTLRDELDRLIENGRQHGAAIVDSPARSAAIVATVVAAAVAAVVAEGAR